MSYLTVTFSTLGVQNVISNGCWGVTAITSKKAARMKWSQNTEQFLKLLAQYGCHDELMRWLIYMTVVFCGDLEAFRLRIAPLFLSPPGIFHTEFVRPDCG